MILNNIKKVIDSWIKMGKIICDQIIKKYVNMQICNIIDFHQLYCVSFEIM